MSIAPITPAPPLIRADKPELPRPAANFGGAVSHRDLVREKLRVDPAALTDRARNKRIRGRTVDVKV